MHSPKVYVTGLLFLAFVISFACSGRNSEMSYDEISETIPVSTLDAEMKAVRDYVPLCANIAHRGTTYWAPEETEISWRWAREMGSDYLEGDLQCSKDGIVLAVHDNSFSRTTDVADVLGDKMPEVREVFYRSFRNADGSQHFSDEDIRDQVAYDMMLGFEMNARDFYYAEILMLDAGKWFNTANPDRAMASFESDGTSLSRTLEAEKPTITYSNGQYISALEDMISFAEGRKLNRDAEGRRILPYRIKSGYENMTLARIRDRSDSERGTVLDGVHYDADGRYMDFVEYDFSSAFIQDAADSGHRPGIYIEFKNSALQPLDIEARTYILLDRLGWNIITNPAGNSDFYLNGMVRTGKTDGKVILQTFRTDAVERVEKVFKGKIPMCYLVDDEPPSDWDPDHYFDTPEDAVKVLDYAITHKCHIIGPSVDGEPNNYPNRYNSWQVTLVRRAGMLNHPWSIDSISQMKETMDAMFTNRSDLTLKWLIDHHLRGRSDIPDPFHEGKYYDNSQAPSTVPDPAATLARIER